MATSSVVESRGCLIRYKRVGAGAPIVFIQGVGLHGDGWLPQTQSLSSDFECITFDNRGMGESQPAGAAITVQQMAEDTLTVMDAAGIRAAHLVGHSLGGVIALQNCLISASESEESFPPLHFGARSRCYSAVDANGLAGIAKPHWKSSHAQASLPGNCHAARVSRKSGL